MEGKGRARLIGLVAVAAVATALAADPASAAVPTGHNPNGLPVASCFWTGPFTAANAKTNTAFPGTEITYWGAKFITPPGARLILRGRYAHARYQSLNAYTNNGSATNSLPDIETRPDAGSVNPYVRGHRRDRPNRSYTASVLGTPPPADPASNTLYAQPDPAGDAYQDILYRVYIPDRGRGPAGGTGLPTPSLRLAGGDTLQGQSMCEALNSNHDYRGSLLTQGLYDALVNWPGKDPATNPGLNPLRFEKFFNLGYTLASYKTPAEQAAADPTPQGIQYNNNDARYMTGAYAFDFGPVLAVRGRLPTTPPTLKGRRTMGGGELRVWDMCVIESLVTTRTWRCLFDQQVPLLKRKGRRYVISVTRAADRPANARKSCGVAWLQADPAGDGAGRPDAGTLLSRNVLPADGFDRSLFDVEAPGTAGEVMGANYPRGSYMSVAQFESYGCPFDWLNGPHG